MTFILACDLLCNPKEYIVQVFFLPLVINNQPLKTHRQAKQNYSARAMVILYCQCKSSFVLLLKLQFGVMSKTFTSWLNLPTIRYKVFNLITNFSKTSVSVPYQKQRYSVIMKQRDSPCCSNKVRYSAANKQTDHPPPKNSKQNALFSRCCEMCPVSFDVFI